MKTATNAFSLTAIAELARERAGQELWLDETGVRTWDDFTRMFSSAREACVRAGVEPGLVVITPGDAQLESLAWLFAVASCGGVAAPLRAERRGELKRWASFLRIDWRVEENGMVARREGNSSLHAGLLLAQLRERRHAGLILATGGTTGVPKLVLHDLDGLLATFKVKARAPRRTLPLMRFDHIGGLDMAWRALAGQQVLVAPPLELSPEAVAATIARHRVEVMPATPSFLNLLLLSGAARDHDLSSLRVVPFGAEPMPAGLLERLAAAFPAVEFTQRFGTSETGALPVRSVAGGLMLDDRTGEFEWKLVDDELWIRSATRALGYLSGDASRLDAAGWFRTGDLASQRADGSVEILGRQVELINVGGEKVLPTEVENLMLEHPTVADCRVYPVQNPVLGQLVAADVVWRGEEVDALAVKQQLHGFARGRLARHKLPAIVRLVAAIGTTRNLKKSRAIA